MTSRSLDESYFRWLYGQVCSVRARSPSRSYWNLMGQLFRKEFVWIIPNDDNRAEDGRDLRMEFIQRRRIRNVDPEWFKLPCSMLEMLIGLSRRLSFEAGGGARDWFWHLIENIELDDYNDGTPVPDEIVNEIVDRVVWRLYSHDGSGGLFPLRYPSRDQRRVELWYQLSAYLLENNPEGTEVRWTSSRSA